MKKRIGLISCSRAKLDRPAPAQDLYGPSDLFRKASQYCDENCDEWYILSAKYGLVKPRTVLEPYDVTLKNMRANERRQWGVAVARQIWRLGDANLEVHAGKYYVEPLIEAGLAVANPLAGLGFGLRKRWYLDRLAMPEANS